LWGLGTLAEASILLHLMLPVVKESIYTIWSMGKALITVAACVLLTTGAAARTFGGYDCTDACTGHIALMSVLFAAIYKVLPARRLEWRDVIVGAVMTAILFTVGKSLIGWYIGSSAVASTYGAAGALIILLL